MNSEPMQTSHNSISHEYTNELIHEKSPYLLQHAHNPVNWYPWCERAFEKARLEDKPIFLSIGYSTCHWCHVMEHDSFENPDVAALLNAHFVAIKVDREERPDIDKVYMEVTHSMTGAGGWPMSVFMMPERKPFFAGTFFPSEDRYGLKGFKSVLSEIATAWTTRREEIASSSERVIQFLNRDHSGGAAMDVTEKTFEAAFSLLHQIFDWKHGGIGDQGPKFPQSHQWTFLLHYWRRSGNDKALKMVTWTLDKMARGGLCDQLGGGFHRYSVDEQWLVSHFEKMLYDQALLSRTYLESFQATGNAFHAQVARDIFEYVLRDMTDPGGAFYSAEDADSEGEEGKFYVWSPEEIKQRLGVRKADIVMRYYDVTPEGNFEGANVLHVAVPMEEFAKKQNMTQQELAGILNHARTTLLAARNLRPRPHRDDKILTAWNGLMISSLAYGAQAFDEPRYARSAARSADFILAHMRRDGRLLRRFRDGQAAVPAFLDDYAFFTNALIDLYEATFDTRWILAADELAREMISFFRDEADGGFPYGAQDNEPHIMPVKEGMDGAEPSGNSVAALALARLARFTGSADYHDKARAVIATFSAALTKSPHAFTQMLIAADFLLGPDSEIVITGPDDDMRTHALIAAARSVYNPNRILIHVSPDHDDEALLRLVPLIANKPMLNAQPTAYVCRDSKCRKPTTDAAELIRILKEN